MLELEFSTESAVVYGKETIYHLGTTSGVPEFAVRIKNPNSFILGFEAIMSPLLSPVFVPKDKSDYEYWRELEFLRISDELTGTSKTKEDFEFEDYETNEARKDDLMVRIRSQLAYSKSIVSKIGTICIV